MKLTFSIVVIVLLAMSRQFLSAQTQLDSARAQTMLLVLDQVTTPFVYASRSFLTKHERWPETVDELTRYAHEHDDSLVMRLFNGVLFSVVNDNHLSMNFQFKPFKLKLLPEELASLVLSLNGRISLSPPIGSGSSISTLVLYVDSTSVMMKDSSLRVAKGLSTLLARIIRPKY
jgi:hypothetical protein